MDETDIQQERWLKNIFCNCEICKDFEVTSLGPRCITCGKIVPFRGK